MRLAVLVTTVGGVNRVVLGTYGTTRDVRLLASDRAADGYAFPGERMVRLPRRLTRGGRRFEDALFLAKRGVHP